MTQRPSHPFRNFLIYYAVVTVMFIGLLILYPLFSSHAQKEQSQSLLKQVSGDKKIMEPTDVLPCKFKSHHSNFARTTSSTVATNKTSRSSGQKVGPTVHQSEHSKSKPVYLSLARAPVIAKRSSIREKISSMKETIPLIESNILPSLKQEIVSIAPLNAYDPTQTTFDMGGKQRLTNCGAPTDLFQLCSVKVTPPLCAINIKEDFIVEIAGYLLEDIVDGTICYTVKKIGINYNKKEGIKALLEGPYKEKLAGIVPFKQGPLNIRYTLPKGSELHKLINSWKWHVIKVSKSKIKACLIGLGNV